MKMYRGTFYDKSVITAPQRIITGAFSVRLTFIREIQLIAADVVVDTS